MVYNIIYIEIHVFVVSSLDYELTSTILTFVACQTRSCVDIPITDDCVVEEDGEVFNVHLRRPPSLDYRIRLSSESTVVNITDDDGRNSELHIYTV